MTKTCSYPCCDKQREGTYRWCTKHRYRREIQPGDSKCQEDTCDYAASVRGYCGLHIQRKKNGLELGMPRRRDNGTGTGWMLSSDGYVVRRDGKGKWHRQHREIMEAILGRELYPNENVHHKNGNRSDNRPENLELWSTDQPAGQRVQDKVVWAKEILEKYKDFGNEAVKKGLE